MDQLPLIIGGIAALLLTKKKAEPVTEAQVQARTDEVIQQRAPDAIGACVKLVKPTYVPLPQPAWLATYNAEYAAIVAKHSTPASAAYTAKMIAMPIVSPPVQLPTYGTSAYQAYQNDINAVSAKYQSLINEWRSVESSHMAKYNSDWNAVLEGYRLKGWKITQVQIGGIVPSGMSGMGDLGQIGQIIGSVISSAILGTSGYKPTPAPITYACPPGTLPIEYQGAIANSIKKNECIVLRSNDPYVSSCMCGSAYTAVPQDVIDALKAKGWTEKTVTPPPPPPPAPGTPAGPWENIIARTLGHSYTTYLCPPGKEPISSTEVKPPVAAPVANWGYEVPPPPGTVATMAFVPYKVCDAAGNVVKSGQFGSGGWDLNLNPGYKRC